MLSKDSHRLTEGSIIKNLIRFALPALGANFLLSLYGAADVFIVSYFSNAAALAATATGAQAIFTIMALAIGLCIGGSIVIGQFFGAKKDNAVKETIATFLSLLIGTGLLCSCVMTLLSKQIVYWLKTPPEAFSGTYSYILICGGGIIFTFLYEGISSILRGLGDSKNPLKFIAIACIANIILDLIFVGGFGWGATGAAVATVMAQLLSVIIAVRYLKKRKFIFDFKIKNIRTYKDKVKIILKISIPSAIQQTFVFMSYTIMTIAVNKLGVVESAVMGITNRIDGFLIMPALAFGSAISVMAAQNMGAGFTTRAKKSFYTGFILSLIFALPSFLLMYDYPEFLMRLTSSDTAIIKTGAEFLWAYSPDCILMALLFCIHGFLNGCGRTAFTMGNNIFSSVVFRIPLILMATNIFEVGMSMPLSTLPLVLFSVTYFYMGGWKKSLIKKEA